jgi:alpha-galactosidase
MTSTDTRPDGGLAETPPMGWNSWNAFGKLIDEERIERQADALVESGLKDAGYEYLVVDGGWRAPERDDDGNMQVDREAFPNGIAGVADYVHERDLKLGLHQAVGMYDCAGETPGTQSAPGGAAQDAELFAEWGVDLLKFDLCRFEYPDPEASQAAAVRRAFERMGDALDAQDRDILYSISEYGTYRPWLWARDAGAHMWRTTGDIADTWFADADRRHLSVTSIVDQSVRLAEYAGPGGWNDPDMLQVGNEGLSVAESRSHFALWCVMGAPLFAGNDLTDLDDEIAALLTNDAAIAIDQDPAGVPGERIRGRLEDVWVKPLADGGVGVVMVNRNTEPATIRMTTDELGLDGDEFHVLDCWSGEEWTTNGVLEAPDVEGHDCGLFRVTPR